MSKISAASPPVLGTFELEWNNNHLSKILILKFKFLNFLNLNVFFR